MNAKYNFSEDLEKQVREELTELCRRHHNVDVTVTMFNDLVEFALSMYFRMPAFLEMKIPIKAWETVTGRDYDMDDVGMWNFDESQSRMLTNDGGQLYLVSTINKEDQS